MSAAYGKYSMEFYKKDKTEDADAAKRAFDWINENFAWSKFAEWNLFTLDGNKIVNNEDDFGEDGLDIKGKEYGKVDWFEQVCREAGVEMAAIHLNSDWSEFDFALNYFEDAAFKNGEWKKFKVIQYNTAFAEPAANFDDSVLYEIDPDTHRTVQHAYKYKPTGKEVLGGHYFFPYAEDDEDDVWEGFSYEPEFFEDFFYDYLDDSPEEIADKIIDGFGDMSDEEKKKKIEEVRDKANWEDLGRKTNPNRTDVYLGLAKLIPAFGDEG